MIRALALIASALASILATSTLAEPMANTYYEPGTLTVEWTLDSRGPLLPQRFSPNPRRDCAASVSD